MTKTTIHMNEHEVMMKENKPVSFILPFNLMFGDDT